MYIQCVVCINVSYNCIYMKIGKIVLAFVAGLVCISPLKANNVKIVGDIKVVPSEIESAKMAPFSFTVQWENSWRDEFNYDAVYVFLKYKKDDVGEAWNHLYLANDITVEGTDGTKFEYELLNPTSGTNTNVGIMIWRKDGGYGPVEVKVSAKWDITSNSARVLTTDDFQKGKVFMSAMAVEMVYVPQMAFSVGDSRLDGGSDSLRFHHRYIPIPEKWDVVSDKYAFQTKDGKVTAGFLPEYAANHTNDLDRTNMTNAWKGDGSANQFWRIDFGKLKNGELTGETKAIRYFAIEGITGCVPSSWELVGLNTEGEVNPAVLYEGTAADWVTTSPRVYPATKAIRIKESLVKPYRYYEIRIKDLGAATGPVIKTVSMCETDLAKEYDNSVLIHTPNVTLTDAYGGGQNWIYTADGDVNGNVKLQATYPTGFTGFFAMKYEVSQEQYVAFLNKLNLPQQNARTVGEKLVSLKEGQYVFGDDPTKPTARNGIILASRNGATEPVVFANNLNNEDGEYAQDGDGQTLACNFLTPADMLAYADWTGLRPMTELEYEKMARQPFPEVPAQGVYAWGSTVFTPPAGESAINSPGSRSEKITSGNANGGKVLSGPVRCGAFAKGAASQQASGASFWGIADLSGNLAEIYYNLNTQGRLFAGLPRSNHGNGAIITKTGDSDINSGTWPINGNAFALRGGSFQSEASALQVSDRSRAKGAYETGLINVRKADVTFRLGCTMEQPTFASVLTLQNGLKVSTANAADTICSGEDYVIRGDIPEEVEGAYSIMWFCSNSSSSPFWSLMEGEHGRDLRVKNLTNEHTADGVFKEYCYMRFVYSSKGYSQSKFAVVRVINTDVQISPREIGVTVASTTSVITVKSKLPMTVQWQFMDNPPENLRKTVTAERQWQHTAMYGDFTYRGIVNTGKQPLVFYHHHYTGFCAARDTVWVDVEKSSDAIEDSEGVICGHPFIDARDGKNTYNTVGIGTQCWMVENLNYAVSGSKCYNNDENNCRIYGRLYNWRQATSSNTAEQTQGVCPKGWHLPSQAEWNALANNANGVSIKRADWEGSNISGFSALPGGGFFYNYTGGPYATTAGINSRSGFYDLGGDTKANSSSRAWWWTSTNRGEELLWSTEYYAYNNNNWTRNFPFYVRLDNSGNLQFNGISSVWRYRSYVTNSIFCSANHTTANDGSYQHLSWAGGNDDALAKMREQFYMSVRCVRNTPLRDDERK